METAELPIKSPCDADWATMNPRRTGRFCEHGNIWFQDTPLVSPGSLLRKGASLAALALMPMLTACMGSAVMEPDDTSVVAPAKPTLPAPTPVTPPETDAAHEARTAAAPVVAPDAGPDAEPDASPPARGAVGPRTDHLVSRAKRATKDLAWRLRVLAAKPLGLAQASVLRAITIRCTSLVPS
jgi:hypothetical protein